MIVLAKGVKRRIFVTVGRNRKSRKVGIYARNFSRRERTIRSCVVYYERDSMRDERDRAPKQHRAIPR